MFLINRNKDLEGISVNDLYKMYKSDEIDTAPYYQRFSDLWEVEKQRLLIDTIINGYDIPKFYFHYITGRNNEINRTSKKYAVIDGKQRIQALIDFIDNKYKLDETVKYLENESLSFKDVKYIDLSKNEYLDIKYKIDSYLLDIIHIETNDYERVEEMFLRLNEGLPVNNAEKRNSIGGFLIEEVNKIILEHNFFLNKVKFRNRRMEHQDLLMKLALLESETEIQSFTKSNLDNLVKKFKSKTHSKPSKLKEEAEILCSKVIVNLDRLSNYFSDHDELLKYKGIVPLYYIFIRDHKVSVRNFKNFLRDFETARVENRKIVNDKKYNYTLLQFDRLNQQGAYQAKSIIERLAILSFYYTGYDGSLSTFKRELDKKKIGLENENK